MKIGKYDITLQNISAFIQGNVRAILHNYGDSFYTLSPEIQEQVIYRTSLANKECLENGKCKCNCSIPELFYADKQCEDKCYPYMMNKSDWEKFKLDNNIELSIKTEKLKITSMFQAVFKTNENEVNLLLNKNSVNDLKLSIENCNIFDFKIKKVKSSCICTKIISHDETLKSGNNTDIILYSIDTKNKSGINSVIITIELESLDLKQFHSFDFIIKFNIKNE